MGRSGAGKSTLHNLRTLVRPARADVAAVEAILDRVGLADRLWAGAGELSGGQQRRVSVAHALYNGRPILVGTSRSRLWTASRARGSSPSWPGATRP
ncbi:hypothetical protein ACU4GR_03335 [Methylobacterium oryzae CBMB20]|uniref:hypothetical protein n=1 Tax=Methylobacterium oryzae TaxID=334852 RepID=UPI002F3500E7